MSTTKTTQRGKTVELGRYSITTGERLLIGRRIEGEVNVYDVAPSGGRSYFVERSFGSKAELAMLVRDYRRQAEQLDACPMSRTAIAQMVARAEA